MPVHAFTQLLGGGGATGSGEHGDEEGDQNQQDVLLHKDLQ
jgi:hypothetical protein